MAGIGSICNVLRDAQIHNQHLVCTGLNPHYQEECGRCLEYADLYPSLEEALEAIDKGSQVTVRFEDNTAIIDVVGDLTVPAAEAVEETFQPAAVKNAENIIFNFREYDYINSRVSSRIVWMARPSNRRVFITGFSRTQFASTFGDLDKYVSLYSSVDEALRGLNSDAS